MFSPAAPDDPTGSAGLSSHAAGSLSSVNVEDVALALI